MNTQVHLRNCAGLLILLSMLLAAGCSPPIGAPLHGTWGIASTDTLSKKLGGIINGENDVEIAETDPAANNQSDPEASEESKDEENSPPRMRLEFRPSGKLTTTTEMGRISPPPKTGTWKVLSRDESGNQMKIECELAGQVTEHELTFVDSDTIELIPPNMAGTRSRLTFKRMR